MGFYGLLEGIFNILPVADNSEKVLSVRYGHGHDYLWQDTWQRQKFGSVPKRKAEENIHEKGQYSERKYKWFITNRFSSYRYLALEKSVYEVR
jgi:hypothetical protein